jgi:hypothetical protein
MQAAQGAEELLRAKATALAAIRADFERKQKEVRGPTSTSFRDTAN